MERSGHTICPVQRAVSLWVACAPNSLVRFRILGHMREQAGCADLGVTRASNGVFPSRCLMVLGRRFSGSLAPDCLRSVILPKRRLTLRS